MSDKLEPVIKISVRKPCSREAFLNSNLEISRHSLYAAYLDQELKNSPIWNHAKCPLNCTSTVSNNGSLSLLVLAQSLGLEHLIKIGHFDLVPAACCDSKDVRGKRIFFEEIFMLSKYDKLRTFSKTTLKGGSRQPKRPNG